MNKHPSNVSETAGNKPTSNATAFTLSGTVVDPFRTFTSALSNSETCPVHASNGTDWQDFIGTYSAGTLAQTTLLESSTGSWIDWSSGGDVQLEIAWLGAHGEDTDAHIASTSNPHGTTAAQVGADPTGTASAAVAAHVAAGNPHPQYFEDPSGTATVGQMIVQSSTGPKWVAYATALNCSVNPVVSGTTQYGNVLTCSTGTWAGFGSISYAYQWYNGATLLSGETANTYTSVIGDIGDTISCTVTATDTLTSASSDSNGIVVEDNILNTSEFYAPLTHSLVLTRGVGNPTYTRATGAWEFDNEGKLITVPSGAARFGGARMVRNLCPTPSTTLTVGSNKTVTFTAAAVVNFSMGAGAGTATFSGTGGATGTLAASGSRVEVQKTITAGTFIVTASVADLADLQIQDVTGQADKTASEYVSVGVLSAPYHGAGVDGVRWLDTNKDGSPISIANLLGYHAEGARTNSLLYSRDLTNAAWVKTNVTAAKTATGIDNAPNSASTLTAGAANATILQTLTLASAARSSSAYVKRRTGTGTISFTRNGGSTWTDITSLINGSTWMRVKIENTSVTNPSVGFKISTSGDAIDVDVVQDEAGAFCSSPIITTTAAVTRNADALTYAKTGNLLDASGSALATWCFGFGSTTAITGYALAVDDAGRIMYTNNSAPTNESRAYDGSSVIISTGSHRNSSTHRKQATAWMGTTGGFKTITEGASSVTTGSYDTTMGAGSDIGVGQGGGNQLYGYVKETHIWQTALNDSELQTVTTP